MTSTGLGLLVMSTSRCEPINCLNLFIEEKNWRNGGIEGGREEGREGGREVGGMEGWREGMDHWCKFIPTNTSLL